MAVVNSSEAYIDAQPEQALNYNQWVSARSDYNALTDAEPDSAFSKIANFFTGRNGRLQREYQTYLDNLNNRNEWLAQQSARAWDLKMDDSKVQRAMKDYDLAGLNPYLLLNGGVSGVSSAPASAKADYKQAKAYQKEKSDAGRNFALVLLAAAKIAAALL